VRGGGWGATELVTGIEPESLYSSTNPEHDRVINAAVVRIASRERVLRDVTLRDLRITGVSSQLRRELCVDKTGANCRTDPDDDGVADSNVNGLMMDGCSNCVIEQVWVHDTDRIAFTVTPGLAERPPREMVFRGNRVDGSIGEHCFATVAGDLDMTGNDFSGCDHAEANGKAVEIWCGLEDLAAGGRRRLRVSGNRFHDIDHGVVVFGKCGDSRQDFSVTDNQIWSFSAPGIWFQTQQDKNELQSIIIAGNQISQPQGPHAVPIRLRRSSEPGATLKAALIEGNLVRFDPAGATDGFVGVHVDGDHVLVSDNLIEAGAGAGARAACLQVGSAKGSGEPATQVAILGNSCVCEVDKGDCVGVRAQATLGLRVEGNSVTLRGAPSQRSAGIQLFGAREFSVAANQVTAPRGGVGISLDPESGEGVIRDNVQFGMRNQVRLYDPEAAGIVIRDNYAWRLGGAQTLVVGQETLDPCEGCVLTRGSPRQQLQSGTP